MIRSKSYIAVPPGETIKEQLSLARMNKNEFAIKMDLSENYINKLLNGEVQLTPMIAMKLESVFGISAKFWNNLETIYRKKIAKVETENIKEHCEIAM